MDKKQINSHEEYQRYLGLLKSNFFSLEFILRAFLYNQERKNDANRVTPPVTIEDAEIGEFVPENSLTNYDSLGDLIDKYNQKASIISNDLIIDRTLVDIRDVLAHGRVFSPEPAFPYYLIKFDKPTKQGQVQVTHKIMMTYGWFKEQADRVAQAIMRVKLATQKLKDIL